MPCGGIYPASVELHGYGSECWYCGLRGADHFVEEWDAFIHTDCIEPFITDQDNEEALIILRHFHTVLRLKDGVLKRRDPGQKAWVDPDE